MVERKEPSFILTHPQNAWPFSRHVSTTQDPAFTLRRTDNVCPSPQGVPETGKYLAPGKVPGCGKASGSCSVEEQFVGLVRSGKASWKRRVIYWS